MNHIRPHPDHSHKDAEFEDSHPAVILLDFNRKYHRVHVFLFFNDLAANGICPRLPAAPGGRTTRRGIYGQGVCAVKEK